MSEKKDFKYPLVSVYTCVYNGERTLHRVFDSMKKLTYPNLEHVIVNDGSTDNTEKLVIEYSEHVNYPVKYHKKENGGKHTALNVAWSVANGDFLVQLDADDELHPHSIKFLVDTYYSIPENIRDQYWCVHGRCVTQYGDFVGDPYPDDINSFDWRTAYSVASKCKGDKLGLQVRKYLSEYRFPEVVGVSHIPEGIVWKQINNKYATWYTNEIVHTYYINEGGNLTAKITKRSQFGHRAYMFKWKLAHPELYKGTIKNILGYALCFFVSTSQYRKNNKYFEGLKKYVFPLALISPFAFVYSLLFRWMRQIK